MSSRKEKWMSQLAALLRDDDVFWNNEIKANIFVSFSLMILAFVLVLSYVLASAGVFNVPKEHMQLTMIINIPIILAAIIVSNVFKGQKKWIKYMLCITSILTAGALGAVLNIFVALIWAIPVILSVRYYSVRLTGIIALLTVVDMLVSLYFFGIAGMVDLNLVKVPAQATLQVTDTLRDAVTAHGYDLHTYLSALFRGSFMPRLLLFIIIAFTCLELSRRAHENILEQAAISRKTEGMRTELSMASAIQSGVLPKFFPPYPARKEFDIYATMTPAKEVGGDFYDFFFIDDDHFMLVMADVSGKGVPASLFMMTSKILLKTSALHSMSPGEIAQSVNDILCSDNVLDMFVTVWMGIVQLSTGEVVSIDAGHEYPILCRADGRYEVFKDKKGFVLGGMEGTRYRETAFTLAPGDTLFLYTDGVPEATDRNEAMFGMDRTLAALNSDPSAGPAALLQNVRSAVDTFVGDAPQFDDLTMLAFRYNGPDAK